VREEEYAVGGLVCERRSASIRVGGLVCEHEELYAGRRSSLWIEVLV